MGAISEILKPRTKGDVQEQRSRERWRDIFGGMGTDKERSHEDRPQVVPGGAWNRSATTSGDNATKRFLAALRSRAPGGWTDDRYEQGSGRHFIGIAYVAIHRILTQWQQSEFEVCRRDRKHVDGKRPVTEDDPPEGDRKVRPFDLTKLLEKPNNQDSFGKMMYRIGQQKYLTGQALNWMVPNMLNVPMEMFVLPTALAIPQPTVNPDYPHGYYRVQPIYPYGPFSSYPSPLSSVGAAVPAQWIIRTTFPHPLLRYDGWSPLTALRLELDEFEMMGRSRHYSMRRSIRPSAVLNMTDMEGSQPLPDDEIARIHAEFEANFQGPENAGKLIVGAPGSTLDEFGQRPIDMDYPSGWEQLSSFLLGGLGITKPAAGLVDDAAYANLWASLKQLHVLTLKPDLDDVAADFTRYLAPYFGDDLIVEIRCPRIDDRDMVMAETNQMITAKCITKNEVRKRNNEELTKEEWGNDIAGDPSPKEEQQQQQAQQQEQMAQQQEQQAEQGPGPEQQALNATLGLGEQQAAGDDERPDTGNAGGLGPRKGLNRIAKHLRDKYKANGYSSNGRH